MENWQRLEDQEYTFVHGDLYIREVESGYYMLDVKTGEEGPLRSSFHDCLKEDIGLFL